MKTKIYSILFLSLTILLTKDVKANQLVNLNDIFRLQNNYKSFNVFQDPEATLGGPTSVDHTSTTLLQYSWCCGDPLPAGAYYSIDQSYYQSAGRAGNEAGVINVPPSAFGGVGPHNIAIEYVSGGITYFFTVPVYVTVY